MSGYILGAYAAAPPNLASIPDNERAWFTALAEQPLVGGLELPYDNGLNPSGPARLAQLLDPSWSSVVTAMSGTSTRMLTDKGYGLASLEESSRRRAIDDIAGARRDILAVRSILGAESITAIQLPSAPGARSSVAARAADALTRSLVEILGWDWEGVALSLEHCDAPGGPRSAQKGFLGFTDEVMAVNKARDQSGVAIGHTINWARSTIESADPATPVAQVALLAKAGSLSGLMFSGVAPEATAFGSEWADAHLPVSDAGDGSESASLLTTAAISETRLAAAGAEHYVGAKVSAHKVEQPLLDRLKPGFATLRALEKTEHA